MIPKLFPFFLIFGVILPLQAQTTSSESSESTDITPVLMDNVTTTETIDENNDRRDRSTYLMINKCCPPGTKIKMVRKEYSCERSSDLEWNPEIYRNPTEKSNKTIHSYGYTGQFPHCSNASRYISNGLFRFKILESGKTIISCEHPDGKQASLMSEIWLSLDDTSYCVDRFKGGEEIIIICEDALKSELEGVWKLLSNSLHKTFTSAAKTTGVISMLSAFILAIALGIYLILKKEQNVHGWTQFSFLMALFSLYLIASLRRLVGFEHQALKTSHSASILEAMEDFAAVATSANLVALSLDLFLTLICRYRRPSGKSEGMLRFCVTTATAWGIGIIVMITGHILKSHRKGTPNLEYSEVTRLEKYLPKLLEFFLCIQNDMVLAICIPVAQITLGAINMILFFSCVFILWKNKMETKMLRKNEDKWADRKIWIRRFLILFILMGLWWPLIIICVFECIVVFKYAVKDWREALPKLYLKPDHVDFNIPWHMYFIPNTLAVQAILVCLLFIFNKKTWNSIKKKFPTLTGYVMQPFQSTTAFTEDSGHQKYIFYVKVEEQQTVIIPTT